MSLTVRARLVRTGREAANETSNRSRNLTHETGVEAFHALTWLANRASVSYRTQRTGAYARWTPVSVADWQIAAQ